MLTKKRGQLLTKFGSGRTGGVSLNTVANVYR
jgi:hypothetical protein